MYSREFQKLVEKYQSSYIGTGNPNAKILIIGKECAIDPKEEQYNWEITQNAEDWRNNIKNNTTLEQVETRGRYNPLYPYKGQLFRERSVVRETGKVRGDGGTSKTWCNYQRILEKLPVDRSGMAPIFFHEYCFVTEFSEATGKMSKDVPEEYRRKSIAERKPLLEEKFFRQFPIVIVACGHYARDYDIDLEEIFNIKWKKLICTDSYWINVHYGEICSSKPKLLIHTRQLSGPIKNELFERIAEICNNFIKENNITL